MEKFYNVLKKIDDEGKEIIDDAEKQVSSLIQATKDEATGIVDASKKKAVEEGNSLQASYLEKLDELHGKKGKELDEQLDLLKEIVQSNWDETINLVLDLLEKQL
jgi:F0F1-type ATP synthase membrane subunit b/b'